jgi:hypothetical protein
LGNRFGGDFGFKSHGSSASAADGDVVTDTALAATVAAKDVVEHVNQAKTGQTNTTTSVATISTRAAIIGDNFITNAALAAVAAKRTTELRQLDLRKRDQGTTSAATISTLAADVSDFIAYAAIFDGDFTANTAIVAAERTTELRKVDQRTTTAATITGSATTAIIDCDFLTNFNVDFTAGITARIAAPWEQGLQAAEQVAASRFARIACVTGFADAAVVDDFAAHRTTAIQDPGERWGAHQGAHYEREQHNLELHREHSPSLPAELKNENPLSQPPPPQMSE